MNGSDYNRRDRQLAKLPPDQRRYSGACVDSPRDADTYETKLRDGDIVIAYVSTLKDGRIFSRADII